jgi:hypothetical protein
LNNEPQAVGLPRLNIAPEVFLIWTLDVTR